MNKPHWFPLDANKLLASTKVALMTTEEIGAYVLLLCHEWNDPTCTLPDDDAVLHKLGRITGDLTRIRSCFSVDKRRLRNLVLYQIWTEAVVIQRVRSEAGVKGNAIRWGSPSDVNATRKGIAKHRQSQSQSQSDKKKKETRTMPLNWSLSDTMRSYGLAHGMGGPTLEHEFEHCKTHHAESRWTEKGWGSKVWQTWVLNWVSFGRKQVAPSGNGSQVPKAFQLLKTSEVLGEEPAEEVRQMLSKIGKGMRMPKGTA